MDKIITLEENKLYTIQVPATLDKASKRLIKDAINFDLRSSEVQNTLDTIFYSEGSTGRGYEKDIDFSWEWKTTRGTLPKRLASWIYKNVGIKLTQDELTKIGNVASQNKVAETLYCDFMKVKQSKMWKAGEFGDGGSCYWESRENMMKLMEDHGFWAMRLYSKFGYSITEEEMFRAYENNRGDIKLGRCWIYPAKKIFKGVTSYVFFNGYMNKSNNGAVDFARLFSHLFGNVPYRKISLSNCGRTEELFYINSARGYVCAPVDYEQIQTVNSFDFNINEKDYGWKTDEDDGYYCDHCENSYNQDSHLVYIDEGRNGSEDWCNSCFEIDAYTCNCCRNSYSGNVDSYTVIDKHGDDSIYCPRCTDLYAWYSDEEDTYYRSDVKKVKLKDDTYCTKQYAEEHKEELEFASV